MKDTKFVLFLCPAFKITGEFAPYFLNTADRDTVAVFCSAQNILLQSFSIFFSYARLPWFYWAFVAHAGFSDCSSR